MQESPGCDQVTNQTRSHSAVKDITLSPIAAVKYFAKRKKWKKNDIWLLFPLPILRYQSLLKNLISLFDVFPKTTECKIQTQVIYISEKKKKFTILYINHSIKLNKLTGSTHQDC